MCKEITIERKIADQAHHTTSASQNACRRRNTGTAAMPQPVRCHCFVGGDSL